MGFTNHSRSKLFLLGGGVFLLSILILHLFFNVLSFDSHSSEFVSEDEAAQDVKQGISLPPLDNTSDSPTSDADSNSDLDASTLIDWRTIYDSSPLPSPPSSSNSALPSTAYNFTTPSSSLPAWQTTPLTTPLVLRLGIISRPSEFALRKAIRQYILAHLPPSEVTVHHRFFVGYTADDPHTDIAVLKERSIHHDIVVLDMPEDKKRMGEKRWRMLRWASESPGQAYDYYMSSDTDAFIRLTALARRLRGLHPALRKPREKSVMWGSMGRETRHYVVGAEGEDGDGDEEVQDAVTEGAWFAYPYGFAILLSSHLVDRLARPGVVLPHRVHYPNDDVVVGNWVNDYVWKGPRGEEDTRLDLDSDSHLTGGDVAIIDDHPAFHDPPGHSWNESSTLQITWDSVVIHHLNVDEMRGVRGRGEFEGDWVRGVDERVLGADGG